MRIAVSGLRHGHIASIVKEMQHYPQLQIVGVAETRPEACENFVKTAGVTVTHRSLEDMIADVEFDALASGDVFAHRGAQAVRALEAGKHILADKPLCTRPDEMSRIRQLAKEKKLTVMVALTMRYTGALQTARRLVREGVIGEVCTATVHGQHALNYKTGRPDWYFEPGQHGGTITDLMVHGIDSLAFMTGHPVAEVIGARAWHMEPKDAPFFQDCAQAMLRLASGAGVMMETSYKSVKGHPAPWTFEIFGTQGSLKMLSSGEITVRRPGEPTRVVEAVVEHKGNVIEDFLGETIGLADHKQLLTTDESLDASEKAVLTQAAADMGKTFIRI
jgi:predicted dehydrogenase